MEAKVNCDEEFFRGKLLLLPAEGTGNVGQLAVWYQSYNALVPIFHCSVGVIHAGLPSGGSVHLQRAFGESGKPESSQ